MTNKLTKPIALFFTAFTVLAAALLYFGALDLTTSAAWDGTVAAGFGGGDGSSAETACEIANGEQLAFLAQQVNSGTDYEGKFFKLTANIDLGGNEWTPIGVKWNCFEGTFDGNGHTVSNFTITKPDESYLGLFGKNKGTIMNLGVEKAEINGYEFVGGVCGYNDGVKIQNCYNIGTVKGYNYVGGVCGFNCGTNYATIENCYNTGTVSGTEEIGGVCGYNDYNGTIQNCYNTGAVSGSKDIGGMCGNNNYSGTIKNCYNTGSVSGNGETSSAIGGVCGYRQGGTITNCYYNKDICTVGGINGGDKEGSAMGLTTEQLCNGTLENLVGFDENVWNFGKSSVMPTEEGSRFGTKTYTYPSLNGVGTAYSVEKNEYNFKTPRALSDDWQEYTLIENEAQFIAIGNDSTSWGKNYVLAKELNLSGKTITPIGNNGTSFTGKFSGNGYTIKNVKMSTDEDLSGGYGLFGVNTGLIMNLAVEGDISYTLSNGRANVGGICGKNDIGGKIFYCSFEGKVYNGGNDAVGGICGENKGWIEYCCTFADVTSDRNVAGGICGRHDDYSGIDSDIYYCYFVGKVSINEGNDDSVGAIVASSTAGTRYLNCYYDKERSNVVDNELGVGKTTKELCEAVNLFGSYEKTWTTGSYAVTPDAENSNLRTVEYTYPKLVCLKKAAKSGTMQQYNFKTSDTDDWQECTVITTAEQFKNIGNDNTSWGKNYVLGANIDLGGEEITPIGDLANPFTGKFSGDGHTVSNFTINSENTCTGLFGKNNGTIMNLGVEKAEINGHDLVGGVCGGNYGTIKNCYSTGAVKGSSSVGGVCGSNSDGGTIKNCYSTDAVKGNLLVGGVCGYNYSGGTIQNCYNIGTVSGTEYVGGVCGYNDCGTIQNCYNTGAVSGTSGNIGGVCGGNYGTIEDCYNTGTVSGTKYVGGVCGRNIGTIEGCYNTGAVSGNGETSSYIGGVCGNNAGTIQNCYNTVAVSGTEYVGGVCGYNNDGDTIQNCYNTGTVSGTEYVGGVCGYNSGGTIQDCYNTGSVSGRFSGGVCGFNISKIQNCYNAGTVSGTEYVGGVCGYNHKNGTITNCYYNKDFCTVGGIGFGKGSATGLTTEQFCSGTLENLAGFDENVWNFGKSSDVTPTEEGSRFGTKTYTYPSLKGVGSAAETKVKFYNFSTSDSPDWHPFTEITTKDKFKAIGEDETSWSKNYVLGANIDLGGEEITPIGDLDNPFTGKFSGNGHTVSNFTINKPENLYLGLFGYNEGTIMNLGVEKAEVSGTTRVGGVCGVNIGKLQNCYNTGAVSGTQYVGGVCGANSGTIQNCYNTGAVSGTEYVGGVCGYNDGGTIQNCYNTVTVSGTEYVGGVCGNNSGTIEDCYNTGTVSGSNDVGGVCGYKYGGTITNCYYNKDICTVGGIYGGDADGSAAGLTTLQMTDGKALETMKFDSEWSKKANDKANGIAYYPNLAVFADDAPSVKYETKIVIEPSNKDAEYKYGDEVKFNVSALIKFDGMADFAADNTAATESKGSFKITVDGDTVVDSTGIFDNTTTEVVIPSINVAGNRMFTLDYDGTNSEYIASGEATCKVNIEKLDLSADKIDFTPPTNLIFDGKAKSASFSGKSGVGEISAKYYLNGVETQPINAGTYAVKIDVAEGDIYKSATDLTSADWTFTIEKATAPAVKVNETSAPWNKNGSRKFTITGLPENHGGFIGGKATVTENSDNIIGNTASFSGGVLTYTLNKLTAADLGKTATVELEIETNNYTTFSVTVEITVTKMTLIAPTNVRVRSDDGRLVISWSEVENAEFYRVQWLDGTVWRTVGQTKNLSYGVKSVVSGETYTYRVLAGDESSYGPASASASATYSAVPKNVKATAENKRTTLTWNKVTNASRYRVQMLKNGVWSTVGTPAANTLVVKNLTNGTKYSFRVLAKSGGVWSIASAVVTTTPSLIPTNVSAAAGNKSITMTWDKLNEASEYRVQMLKNNVWTTIALPTANTYTVKNLTNGTKYSFKVLANVDGKWSVASIVVTAKPDLIPANFRAVVAGKSITLRWTALSGATRYRIQRLSDSTWSTIGYASGTSFVDKNVESGKSYSYRILCFDGTAWHTPSAAITGSLK